MFSLFLVKFNGFLIFFLFIFRSLREDQRFFSSISVDPFQFFGDSNTFFVNRGVSVVFRFVGSIFNPLAEHFYFFFLIMFLLSLLGDFGFLSFFDKISIFYYLEFSFFIKTFVFIFLFFRQSTYSYFI